MQGGFLHKSSNLVTGNTGTGKTIFGLQFVWEGLKRGEPCVYVTLEEDPREIHEDALAFGWDLKKYEAKGLFKLLYHDPAHVGDLSSVILEELEGMKAHRLVVDSTALIGLTIETPSQIRRRLVNLINSIRDSQACTTLIISEITGDNMLSRFGIEEFVADGVIVMHYLGADSKHARALEIRKMRRTRHGEGIYPFEIGPQGIVLTRPD